MSLLKGVTQRKFHAVVVQNNGKEIEKTVLDVRSFFAVLVALKCGEFSIDRMNMSKTKDCGRKLSAIIFLGNQMIYS